MMERKGLETSRYLGGDPMLSILICDDDKTILAAMKESVENILREVDKKAKIHTFARLFGYWHALMLIYYVCHELQENRLQSERLLCLSP